MHKEFSNFGKSIEIQIKMAKILMGVRTSGGFPCIHYLQTGPNSVYKVKVQDFMKKRF